MSDGLELYFILKSQIVEIWLEPLVHEWGMTVGKLPIDQVC